MDLLKIISLYLMMIKTFMNFSVFIISFFIVFRDVTTGKFLELSLRWWGRICPPGWNRVKVSENLGGPCGYIPAVFILTLKKFSPY